MKKIALHFFLAAFVSLFLLATPFAAHSQQAKLTPQSAPDEIIVKFKESTPESEKVKLHEQNNTTPVQKIEKLRIEVVKVPNSKKDATIESYKKNKFVEFAEPNYVAQAYSVTNDTSLSQQWGLFKIDAADQTALSAWDVSTGSAAVKIAILDCGIDAAHTDLTGKIVGSANFTTSPTLNDIAGHGTHVAGIAAAATNNGTGVAGTGYNTALLNGKVLGDDGSGYYSWIANGIIWAADNGAQVINMSLGGSSSSQALQDAVDYGWNKGVVIVGAAGNSNTSAASYPGFYTNVIAVAATDSNDARASFSNYGSWVDVAAPGVSIYSTYKGNTYATLSGTSMATPFAAGTAALIWAKGYCTSNACVRTQLEGTADHITGTGTLWSFGRINAFRAINEIAPSPTPTATPTPTPVKSMTVANITMNQLNFTSTTKRVTSTIYVTNEQANSALSSVSVSGNITTPSGAVSTFSGTTGSNGKVTVTIYSKEKGMYTTKIINLTKSGFAYHPTVTSQTLLVQ